MTPRKSQVSAVGLALARSAKTPLQSEYAATLPAAVVVSWNRFAIAPMTAPARAPFEFLIRAKRNVKHNDVRIAAIAKDIGPTVVTRNHRDFGRVPGIFIEDWATYNDRDAQLSATPTCGPAPTSLALRPWPPPEHGAQDMTTR